MKYDIIEFCAQAGECAQRRFNVEYEFGIDLCLDLINVGAIKMSAGVEVAACIMAEYTGQYN
jgi:hypothetical protein